MSWRRDEDGRMSYQVLMLRYDQERNERARLQELNAKAADELRELRTQLNAVRIERDAKADALNKAWAAIRAIQDTIESLRRGGYGQ